MASDTTQLVLALQAFLQEDQEHRITDIWKQVSVIDGVKCTHKLGATPHMTIGSWQVPQDQLSQAKSQFLQNLKIMGTLEMTVRVLEKDAEDQIEYYLVPETKESPVQYHRTLHETLGYEYETFRQIDLPGQWWPHVSLFNVTKQNQPLVAEIVEEFRKIQSLRIVGLALVTFGPITIEEELKLRTDL